MGTTFACFHCFGILEVWSDNLINLVSDGAIVDPASFNILGLIPSGPVALLGSRLLINSATPASDTFIWSIKVSSAKLPIVSLGSLAFQRSILLCNRKNSLNIFAFSSFL